MSPAGSVPTLYLVDAPGFVFRAYHALPPLTSSRGTPTGAVLGFANMLIRLLEDHHPDFLAAVFDTGAPSFRADLYPEYKAHRPPMPEDLVPQFPLVDRLLDALNVRRLAVPGFEADDVIATLTARGRALGLEVVIVSSDKDLMQLAGDGVRLLDTMKDRRYGPEEVKEKFGVLPEQLGDWLALVGDASDNVPGVPGVGPKTATKLLEEFGDLERLLAGAERVKGKRLQATLGENADRARMARQLVALRGDCPLEVELEDLRRRAPDAQALQTLLAELELTRLQTRLAAPATSLDRSLYRTTTTRDGLDEVLRAIRAAGRVAVDLETTSLDAIRARIVGVSVCWGAGCAAYIPTGHRYLGAPPQLAEAEVLAQLGPLLSDPAFPKFGQNHKYDWLVLKRAGVEMSGVTCDPMLASYVLDPSRQSHGLDELAQAHLGHRMITFKEVAGPRGDFSAVEVPAATAYAAEDAEATFLLAERLGAEVDADPELRRLLHEVELPLTAVLARMELTGCAVELPRLKTLGEQVDRKARELEATVRGHAGWDVNVNSPKQLQKLLFEQLGLSAGRKTKTGYSTDAEVLAELALEHPVAALIDEYRTLTKLKSTYIDALASLVNPETHRVHTSYNQAVAATGRLSSSDPNLQNIPVRTELGREIRRAFVAPPGKVLLTADYSQIELRVLAHLSEDPLLTDAFRRGQDVHLRTAEEVFGVRAEEVTDAHRRVAKAVNFGVIYGQSDFGLARQLGIPREEARRYIEGYFARYAGVRAFMERTIEEARRTKVVRTLLGRRRPLPDIDAARPAVRQYAERVARNTPVQGTAADLMKLAMLKVDRRLRDERVAAEMILTVHDELVLEVEQAELGRAAALLREAMTDVMTLAVPLVVDLGWGTNWADQHELGD
ncbi:MAG: DNA polymerase I [Deltaproteobacteria bacterium]|nr:DNA polymerase I [Deltaproteobacteria bacterium]